MRIAFAEIGDDVLQLIRDLRPTLESIRMQDRDLHNQLRRALSSVSLNIAEGEWRRNGNARIRFETAMGSANESARCLRTADALGYVGVSTQHVDTLDRVARSLHKLTR